MVEKAAKIPGPEHPIVIAPAGQRVVVRAAGKVIADTKGALSLAEASYRPVFYVPRADVDMALLERTAHSTYCPYKGECSYYSIVGAERGVNAVWSYEAPYDSVAAIKGFLAFYPDRVELAVG